MISLSSPTSINERFDVVVRGVADHRSNAFV